MPYFDAVAAGEAGKSLAETDGFLFGRKTYEIMAAYWPHVPEGDLFGDVLNPLPKYVASTTLEEPLSGPGHQVSSASGRHGGDQHRCHRRQL